MKLTGRQLHNVVVISASKLIFVCTLSETLRAATAPLRCCGQAQRSNYEGEETERLHVELISTRWESCVHV